MEVVSEVSGRVARHPRIWIGECRNSYSCSSRKGRAVLLLSRQKEAGVWEVGAHTRKRKRKGMIHEVGRRL